jgi:hypothetical protein
VFRLIRLARPQEPSLVPLVLRRIRNAMARHATDATRDHFLACALQKEKAHPVQLDESDCAFVVLVEALPIVMSCVRRRTGPFIDWNVTIR